VDKSDVWYRKSHRWELVQASRVTVESKDGASKSGDLEDVTLPEFEQFVLQMPGVIPFAGNDWDQAQRRWFVSSD
tara:strand:- start:1248 stop:1472 length:225 start_codon:yes stop_codon:yes gene_type:complete